MRSDSGSSGDHWEVVFSWFKWLKNVKLPYWPSYGCGAYIPLSKGDFVNIEEWLASWYILPEVGLLFGKFKYVNLKYND